MTPAWTIEIDHEWIAWMTFDLPGESVNKFTASSLEQLDTALDKLEDNEAIKAIAIRSGKQDSFIVGADIDALARIETKEQALEVARQGQRVFKRLSTMPVPTIAVVHGAAMGGGLEMGLACTCRLVSDHEKTTLGLPEVNLGILPGWGGTQRLPRLIGLPAALGMILTGKPASPRKAWRIGLADGVIAAEFYEQQTRDFVNRFLRRSGQRDVVRRRLRCQPRLMRLVSSMRPARAIMFRRARRQVMARTNGNYPAPLVALRVIQSTFRRTSLDEGLAIEAGGLADLAPSGLCKNLVWLFQASQRARKGSPQSKLRSAEEMNCAGVVGGGTMGGGIAWALSNTGIRVRLQDISLEAAGKGVHAAAKMYRSMVKRRKMTKDEMNLAMHRIGATTDYSGFSQTQIVIEAVIEDLAIKKSVLRDIEDRVSSDAIIATNTSSLPLGELARVLRKPQRFVGLHFFNPVNRMKLVEVIAARKTSRKTLETAADLVRRIGKTPIIVGDCPGFLVNRILLPYLIESTWMLEEGIDAVRLDGALERFGMPMGPLTLIDEVGIDVGFKVAKVLEAAYGDRMLVASALGQIAESGEFLGKKTGRGIYLYNNGKKKFNDAIPSLLEKGRQQDGIRTRELTDSRIVDRAVLMMVNEAARCLDEGVAESAESIDLAMVFGTGFAPFRGGLLRYADDRGLREIRDRLEQMADEHGERFRPAPLIEKLSRCNGRFHDGGRKRRVIEGEAA